MKTASWFLLQVRVKAGVGLAAFATIGSMAGAAGYEWSLSGDLNPAAGGGAMSYADAASQSLTTFGVTDGVTVPNMNNEPATYMSVPAFTGQGNGYYLDFIGTYPNGGGAYMNHYTFIADILSPATINWTPIFNTDPSNGNDADFYIAPDGSLGIGELGYSASGLIAPDTWYRIAFAADLSAGNVSYYIDGTPVHNRTGGALTDGRFSLYTGQDPGPDLLLFNEGDTSGQYTHSVLVSSIYFVDQTLTAEQIGAFGGPIPAGVVVPEPGTLALLGLAGLGWLAWRVRRRV